MKYTKVLLRIIALIILSAIAIYFIKQHQNSTTHIFRKAIKLSPNDTYELLIIRGFNNTKYQAALIDKYSDKIGGMETVGYTYSTSVSHPSIISWAIRSYEFSKNIAITSWEYLASKNEYDEIAQLNSMYDTIGVVLLYNGYKIKLSEDEVGVILEKGSELDSVSDLSPIDEKHHIDNIDNIFGAEMQDGVVVIWVYPFIYLLEKNIILQRIGYNGALDYNVKSPNK